MDRTQMVARLLSELAATRAAVTASYVRLWRPAERALRETDDFGWLRDATQSREIGPASEERPAQDAD